MNQLKASYLEMLTDKEFDNIFDRNPYRKDWPRFRNHEAIESYYHNLINEFKNNQYFSISVSQDGGMSNYLEYVCYPHPKHIRYEGNSILVCISLCAPIVAYGQTSILISGEGFLFQSEFIKPETLGTISDPSLKNIEKEVLNIIQANNLIIIDKEYASKKLPDRLASSLDSLNFGDQYLHGLFQWMD